MAEQRLYAGIDVSKAKLDLAIRIGPKQHRDFSFANSKAGVHKLLAVLLAMGATFRIILEPTSRQHVRVLLTLAATPGCEVMPVNPRQARRFQQGRGGRAKNDKLDAHSLSDMAKQLDDDDEFLVFVPPSDELRELQLLGRQVAVCVDARSRAKCRISSYPKDDPVNTEAIVSNERIRDFHQAEIDHLVELMLRIVMADERLKQIYELLIQIRGIGKQSALQLMGELLVLPQGMGPRQWVACAGLDPQPKQSGMSNLPARISRMGNRYLKKALYMAAMNTTQWDPQIGTYYEQFHLRKGSKRLSQVVVMRRLLHGFWQVLNRMVPLDIAKCFPVPSG